MADNDLNAAIDARRAFHAAQIREQLLDQGDEHQAVLIANTVIEETLDRLNDFSDEASVATSLIARALVSRALFEVAARWAHDFGGGDLDLYRAALASIRDNPPDSIAEKGWREDEETPGRVH